MLDIDKSKLVDELKALLPEKKGDDNSKLIDEALKLPVNASGAVMMMVTTENGPHLVAAHSQRRGMLIQTNGRCEKGESMQETALREFFEELGNPSREDILSSVLLNEENYRGIKGINEIGDNATTIAKRIINNKDEIYVNVSALYANKKTVSHADLDKEIQTLNKRLAASKDFYQEACLILFGNEKTKPGDLKDPTVRKHASEIIDRFKEKCSEIITSNFEPVLFAQYEANPDDVESVKNALRAIVDLSENDRIELLSPESIKTAMNLRKNNLDEFKKIYFDAGFGLLDEYIGKQSPDDFFNSLSI